MSLPRIFGVDITASCCSSIASPVPYASAQLHTRAHLGTRSRKHKTGRCTQDPGGFYLVEDKTTLGSVSRWKSAARVISSLPPSCLPPFFPSFPLSSLPQCFFPPGSLSVLPRTRWHLLCGEERRRQCKVCAVMRAARHRSLLYPD